MELRLGFLERLLDQLYGGDSATEIWSPCLTCSAQEHVVRFFARQRFSDQKDLAAGNRQRFAPRARQRLFDALQAVHLRGETHITVRELRAALVYHFVWNPLLSATIMRARNPHHIGSGPSLLKSAGRQGDVLGELVRLDPALEAHPQIDRTASASQRGKSNLNQPDVVPTSSGQKTPLGNSPMLLTWRRADTYVFFKKLPISALTEKSSPSFVLAYAAASHVWKTFLTRHTRDRELYRCELHREHLRKLRFGWKSP